jgi:hypothetical protein
MVNQYQPQNNCNGQNGWKLTDLITCGTVIIKKSCWECRQVKLGLKLLTSPEKQYEKFDYVLDNLDIKYEKISIICLEMIDRKYNYVTERPDFEFSFPVGYEIDPNDFNLLQLSLPDQFRIVNLSCNRNSERIFFVVSS